MLGKPRIEVKFTELVMVTTVVQSCMVCPTAIQRPPLSSTTLPCPEHAMPIKLTCAQVVPNHFCAIAPLRNQVYSSPTSLYNI